MAKVEGYVLGQSVQAARRLEIQDAHFGDVSETLLDEMAIKPHERVVELGCGPGGFSRRIIRRLGPSGVLVAVDASEGLLSQNQAAMAALKPAAKFEPVLADIPKLGNWIDGADVLIGRAILHHIPMVEFMLGRLRTVLRPGTRLGFIEPDFRSLLGKIGHLEATSRPDLSVIREWARAINALYQANDISAAVGATMARTFEIAGFRNIRTGWFECVSNSMMIENMVMFFDEVRDRLRTLGVLTPDQIDDVKRRLQALPTNDLPAAWGTHYVVCETP